MTRRARGGAGALSLVDAAAVLGLGVGRVRELVRGGVVSTAVIGGGLVILDIEVMRLAKIVRRSRRDAARAPRGHARTA